MCFRSMLARVAALLALISTPLSLFAMPAVCDATRCITHHDSIPNFAGQPTIQSMRTGSWSNPSTWSAGRVPDPSDIVLVTTGTTVSYDGLAAQVRTIGIQTGGVLAFRTDISTHLTVGTLLILPQGSLRIGTAGQPVQSTKTAELVIADQPLDLVNDGQGTYDPQQYGAGLVSIDGSVTVSGSPKTAFVRLSIEPHAGDPTLQLEEPVSGWRVGDRLFLPDSKHYVSDLPYIFEGEEMTVAGISADGLTVTLTSPLAFTHPGARNADGVLEFLPHVGNLTRNVVVRSENPGGTRGHVLLTGHSEIDIRYALLRDLGRTTVDPLDNTILDAQGNATHLGTNQIGRYPLHLHHLIGPAVPPPGTHQFTLLGNSIEDQAPDNRHKWALTVHNSHYGLISQNVIYNAAGWGIGIEQGNESYNEFVGNFVARVRGVGDRMSDVAGNGFWFRGPNNYIRGNVAANLRGDRVEAARGFQFFFRYLGNIAVPQFAGADVDMGQGTIVNGNALPLLEFTANEVYGATEIGLAIWWLGAVEADPLETPESVVRDFRVWHHSLDGYYGYAANNLTFDGFQARGDLAKLDNPYEFVLGITFGDYMNKDVVIRNADIQNLRTGIVPPLFMRGTTVIEDSLLRNTNNVVVMTLGTPGGAAQTPYLPPKASIIRNVRFETLASSPGGLAQHAIVMQYTTHYGAANLIQLDTVFVEAFDGVPGDDFQVFYNEQRPDFIVPQSSGYLVGSPEAGLTNAQNWSRYGIAIAGAVATEGVPRAGIYGLVQAGSGGPPSSSPPTIVTQPVSQIVLTGQSATFTVGATGTDPLAYQWQKNGVNILGGTGATYVTSPVTTEDSGAAFRVVVSNSAGSATSAAATLTVTAPVLNHAPVVSAGSNLIAKARQAVTLTGSVNDDGLPDPPARVTVAWTKVTGPGTVAFGSPTSPVTTATFSKIGTYVLMLSATDGALTAQATATVTVTKK